VHIPFVPDDSETLTRLAAVLAERSDELLAAYVEGTQAIRYELLQTELVAQSRAAEVCPVFVGSALTGAGVRDLLFGIAELLPTDSADAEGPTHGTVFKVDRIESGAKVAYVRVHSGTIRVRDRLPISHGGLEPSREGKVTGITVFDKGSASAQTVLPAGRLGTVRGLADVRVGDILGTERESTRYARHFAPPTLEAIVVPRDPVDRGALRSALSLLAEQDPLIDVRQNDATQEISVSLYGEVQKEVIQATLANDFDIVVEFRETTTVYIERPIGTGEYVARLYEEAEPFLAGVGLRVDPAATESGVEFRLEVELGSMPYAFFRAVKETVGHALSQGLYGWRVTDCRVTMTHSAYLARQSSAHGVFDKNSSSTAGDFRNLTPLVLLEALRRAGTQVCEPIHQFELEIPAELVGTILSTLARLRAVPQTPAVRGSAAVVRGDIPAASVHELERRLPALTGGEGLIEVAFARYDPVRGAAPIAPRRDSNPLDRNEYLLRVVRRVPGGPG
jgi:ribosomal protection tetracycline resistance protein